LANRNSLSNAIPSFYRIELMALLECMFHFGASGAQDMSHFVRCFYYFVLAICRAQGHRPSI